MPYSVELPDGTLVSDIPDDMPPAEVQQRIYAAYPQFAPTARTTGEAFSDIGAQLKKGAGQLAQFPGQLYGLATGDFSETGLYGYGKQLEAEAEAAKSAGLKAREAARAQAIAEAEKSGQLAAAKAAIGETITDPALMVGLLAENLPSMLLPGGAAATVGRTALRQGLAKGVESAAAREAAIAAGRRAAVGVGAVQQGADVGTGAYEEVYKRLVSQGVSEPEAAAQAINLARAAGVSGAIISMLAQRLPGASKLEEVLAGRVTGKGLGRAVLGGAAGEALGEVPEEVGGRFTQNLALREVDPTQALTAGLGETGGMAAVAGAGLGGLGGGISAMRGTPETATAADAARQEAQQRILAAREQERVKAEAETPFGVMGPYAQEQYGQLEQEKQRLLELPQAPNVKERVAEIIAQQKQLNVAEVTRLREEKAQQEGEAAKAAQSAFAQPEVRETPEGQGLLFSQFEAPEARVQPETVPAPTAPEPQPLAPSTMEKEGQRRLGLRGGKAGKGLYREEPLQIETGPAAEALPPVTEPVPEPTLAPKRVMPPELQPVVDKLSAAGVRPEVQTWAENARNRPFLRKLMGMADMAPQAIPEARKALKFKEGSEKAEIFDALFPTPGVPAFEPAAGAGESRLGLLGQLGITPSEAPAPRAGEPVGRGVVPAGRAAPAPAKPEGRPAPALAPAAYPSLTRAEQYWNDTADAAGGPAKPFSELTPAQRGAWREAVQAGDAQTLRDEYARLTAEVPKVAEEPKRKAAAKPELRKELEDLQKLEEEPPLFEAVSTLTREPSIYGDEVQRSPSLSRTIAALRRRLDEGKLTPEEFAVRVERAHDAYKLAQGEKTRPPRERGADYIRERLLGAKRRGEFDEREIDLAEWFIRRNPALLDDLAISIVKPETESAVAGRYDPLYRLMTLFKDAETDGTIVHEILHHLERMMPAEVQAGIRKAWLTSLERASEAAQRGTDQALKDFYKNLQAFHTSETGTVKNFTAAVKAIKDGQVSKDHYQHVNPSEFWAENGTAIVQKRFAASNSIVARLKQWLSELGQTLKSAFGLSSNAPIIRALDSLAKADGKFVSDKMLMEGVPLYSVSPTEGIAAQSELMKEAPSSLKKSLNDMMRIVGEKDDVPFATRFRTEAADVAASVVNRLNILFDGKVRDELTGLTNPELLIRQAQASEALFSGFLASGGVEKDSTTGQYVVTDKAGPGGSVADMLTAIKNWSDAKGMDFKLGYAEASKMLEARRLDAMRQANVERKQKGQDLFPIHKLAQDADQSADEQIDIALRGLKANPEIAEVADNMDKQRAYMIDKMVAVGRISKDTAQEWKDAAGYVPFDRVEDFFDKYTPKRTSGRGLAQLGSLPQFVGTTQREVGNVFDNHTKLMGWMLKQTLKQDATATTLNVLADIGQAKRLGGNKAAASNPNNVVKSYKNGKEEYFEVRSHWDAVAFRDAPEVKGTLVKLFAQVSNILRKIVTVMPPFVAKQVTDDIQRAFITSGVRSPSRLVVPAITNFLRIAGHEVVFGKSHLFTKEFAKKGLVGDIDYNASNPAETVLFNMGYSKRGWLSELHHRLESITRASDLAMRKAIYDRTMAEENEDVGLATARAREFINFRRRGASKTVGMAVATIPFFNAYLQSNDLLYRSMIGRGSSITERAEAKRLFWTQAAKMTTFALIYALANSDDEEYDKLSFEEKANNWVVDGKKLPAPGDMAALFKVPVEALVHYMSRQGTEEEQLTNEVVKQVLGYTYEQFVGRVTPVPQAIRPVAEALTNYSFLTMRPLVGTYQRGLPEEFQTVSTTSELAKAIAKFSHNNIVDPLTDTPLDLSPIVIDNTLRGYLGGVVPLMNMLIDQMVNPNKTDRPLSKYWFVGQYLTPEVPSGPKDEFYDLVNKVMPVKRALDKLASTDIDAAMKYYEKNADKLKMAELVNTALQTVRQTRQYINYLDSENGAAAIPDSAERLKKKQEAERYLNEQLSWVRAAKAQIFGKAE